MNSNDIKRAIEYARKNGIKEMYYAAKERLEEKKSTHYVFEGASSEELDRQRNDNFSGPKISILVPAFETKQSFMEQLIRSVLAQTYDNFELIIADASISSIVEETVQKCILEAGESGKKIKYVKLPENKGISINSNEGLKYCSGEYVALLDHDDIIEPDALYLMAKSAVDNSYPALIYTDEDKCDENGGGFNTPNYKEDFNLDLFLTNNYICHFTMVKGEIIRNLEFRDEYDGAQDYDLFLRVIRTSGEGIVHVPKVLYHWRCHNDSTSENPSSKKYAYQAGLMAVRDFYKEMGIKAIVSHGKHLGFYDTSYDYLFEDRKDIGAVGGPIFERGITSGGAMGEDGKLLYGELPERYSGYMNRASLSQNVSALDIRNIKVRQELSEIYYRYLDELVSDGADARLVSLALSEEIRGKGYLLLYDPKMTAAKKG